MESNTSLSRREAPCIPSAFPDLWRSTGYPETIRRYVFHGRRETSYPLGDRIECCSPMSQDHGVWQTGPVPPARFWGTSGWPTIHARSAHFGLVAVILRV